MLCTIVAMGTIVLSLVQGTFLQTLFPFLNLVRVGVNYLMLGIESLSVHKT